MVLQLGMRPAPAASTAPAARATPRWVTPAVHREPPLLGNPYPKPNPSPNPSPNSHPYPYSNPNPIGTFSDLQGRADTYVTLTLTLTLTP